MLDMVDIEAKALRDLGGRLRRRRIAAADPQARAAARIGVSLPTYRKLEQGDPCAQIGLWVRALRLYDRAEVAVAISGCPAMFLDAGVSTSDRTRLAADIERRLKCSMRPQDDGVGRRRGR